MHNKTRLIERHETNREGMTLIRTILEIAMGEAERVTGVEHGQQGASVWWWEGEVCTVGSLDIITRLQDDYTCHLADGLAEIFARYWKGEVDSG